MDIFGLTTNICSRLQACKDSANQSSQRCNISSASEMLHVIEILLDRSSQSLQAKQVILEHI